MDFDLKARTILLTMGGSHAYGTAGPTSDVDVKGVCVPPRAFRDGFLHRFEQADTKQSISPFVGDVRPDCREVAARDGIDGAVYEVRKFFLLAADANPNILDVLFCDPEDRLIVTPQGQKLLDARDKFLSKKVCFSFRGYAISQLHRIRGHRAWLLNPPSHQPTREEYDLPERTLIPADQLMAAEAAVRQRLDGWEFNLQDLDDATRIFVMEQVSKYVAELQIFSDDKFRAAARAVGYDENFIALLDRERHYKAAKHAWEQYQTWKKERNEKRAALEAKFGYDTKHALHLVRLLRMCSEILTTGEVHVRRPDAAELLAIRDGAWTYDQLDAWATEQDTELLALMTKSTLRKQPDRQALDQLCQDICAEMD
jgi:hypothetical protein